MARAMPSELYSLSPPISLYRVRGPTLSCPLLVRTVSTPNYSEDSVQYGPYDKQSDNMVITAPLGAMA